ncbi:DNA circularization protein [Pseudoduganella violaceinigra]|uniref:DNA circularization protein n=1 Tax=Pseudoduganella violaceinigra TaxID=246602 RepID=UPI00042A15B9|nr:DNA circularization N-terminal domain-containing protein [Pseudoduganella violaceinigra]
MTWRDQLQPASFRGVPFDVVAGSLTAGRRLARHEYPQRDFPYLEDMGRRAREYKVEAYVIGPDYMSGRDQLLAAIEEEGPGQLVHRYYGTKLVVVAECELSESTEFGGLAKFTLHFVESGEQAQPTVGIDSGAELLEVQDVAYGAIMDDFTQELSVDGLPSWGVGDILSSLDAFLALDDFRRSAAATTAVRARLGSLIEEPRSLALELIGLVRSVDRVTGILERPYVSASASVSAGPGQSVRSVVRRQQAVLTLLVKRAALVRYAGLASGADLSTAVDVQTVRAAILGFFDAHDYAPGAPRPSATVATALKAVRSAALVHLSRQGAALPRTYSMQLLVPQPALVLSYALYGDLRNDDIVKRNALRHPGFIPAGVSLQLAAE